MAGKRWSAVSEVARSSARRTRLTRRRRDRRGGRFAVAFMHPVSTPRPRLVTAGGRVSWRDLRPSGRYVIRQRPPFASASILLRMPPPVPATTDLTFLFADVEGSTRLAELHGAAAGVALELVTADRPGAVRGRPLSFADRRAQQSARRPRGDGRDARRPHHGSAAQDASRARRAVSPRVRTH